MKNIKDVLLESKIDDAISQFADIFKSVVLKEYKLKENDFKDLGNDTFRLENSTETGRVAKDFYKSGSSMIYGVYSYTGQDVIELGIPQTGKETIFIKLNLDGTGDNLAATLSKGIPGNIVSVDMSKEIKDKLI